MEDASERHREDPDGGDARREKGSPEAGVESEAPEPPASPAGEAPLLSEEGVNQGATEMVEEGRGDG